MTKIEQKRGFYSVTTDEGKNAKLTRVTTALDWVLGDGKSAMAYYGGKQFAKYLADHGPGYEDEWNEYYTDWKASPYDPNRTLRSRASEGTASHKLFERLLLGQVELEGPDHEGDYFVAEPDGIPFLATGYDRGVIELYLHHYATAHWANVETEKRLFWTEHPIDDCYEDVCTHGYSGTCDVFWPQAGQIDDLKTHAPGYRFSEWVQMAMYARAAEQMTKGEWVCKSQRIVLAHDTADEETGLSHEVQDDRYVDPDSVDAFWELYKVRKAWGPK